jgi:hypothetical protein
MISEGARVAAGLLGVSVPIELASSLREHRLREIERRILKIEAALATEARRAETVEQGSVHEGAGPQDNAQPTPGDNHHD